MTRIRCLRTCHGRGIGVRAWRQSTLGVMTRKGVRRKHPVADIVVAAGMALALIAFQLDGPRMDTDGLLGVLLGVISAVLAAAVASAQR